MELQIEPEPSPEERAAIIVALERTAALGAEHPSPWAVPELDDELAAQPLGA